MTDSPLAVVVAAVRGLASRDVVAVALDGFSGAGKSTLAHELTEQLGGAVLEGDDFYRVMDDARRWGLQPAEGVDFYFDWERMRDEALTPLRSGLVATYLPYDWAAGGGLSPRCITVAPAPVVIVDGVYSSRPELSSLIDLAVFVETSRQARNERIRSRNHGNDRWHARWTAAENFYFQRVRPPDTFDLIVQGE